MSVDRRPLHARATDLAFLAIALLFGAASLARPFGRDQGVYYYVGREWLLHGAVPYRDTFDQKTPGIFLVHGLAVALFGEQLWPIRAMDLACAAALGFAAARVATPSGRPVPAGLYGIAALSAVVLYIGHFDFWYSAQCEIWCTALALAGACAVLRLKSLPRAMAYGGCLCGLAILFKPPVLPLVLLVGAAAHRRARAEAGRGRSTWRWVALHAGCVAAPTALTLAYFASAGASSDMADVLLGANEYYVRHGAEVHSAAQAAVSSLAVLQFLNPEVGILLIASCTAAATARVRGDRSTWARHAFALAGFAAAWLGGVVQLKFYSYHWGLVVGPAVLLASNLAFDLAAATERHATRSFHAVAPWLFCACFLAAFAVSGAPAKGWARETELAAGLVAGALPRARFARSFSSATMNYPYGDLEAVGIWLREHTAPDDAVAVRGFEPELYAIAHRRFCGRFFWTPFLTDPRRAYHREAWLAQDRAQLAGCAPRWVVAMPWADQGPDAPQSFLARGYVLRETIGGYAILERGDRP